MLYPQLRAAEAEIRPARPWTLTDRHRPPNRGLGAPFNSGTRSPAEAGNWLFIPVPGTVLGSNTLCNQRLMAHKLYIKTMGCQMNEYDSSRMVDLLAHSHGYEVTDNP